MKYKFLLVPLFSIALPFLAHADQIEVNSTGITFDGPADFIELSDEMISRKWPTNQAPQWAVGTENGTTTIAYDLKPHDISNAPFDQLLGQFEDLFDRMIPGIEWIESEVITIEGKEWIFMEMTSNAVDTDIHNIMLATSYESEMLVFNFNSTVEEFSKYEAELRESIETIRLP